MKKILILLIILFTNNVFANQEEIKKMVFKSESYNLGLNKKDTTIQGIKLKPITRTDAFKHSVKKNYGWTKYGIKIVNSSEGMPIRYGDTAIRFELRYDDCGFLYKNGKERDCIRSTPHHRVEVGQGHNKDISLGFKHKQDYWYTASFYFPKEHKFYRKQSVFQFHSSEGPYHPPFHLEIFPKEGWVEHDPIELLNSQKKAIQDVLINNKVNASEIDSIGITNQRETTVVWNKNNGKPVYNTIVWQDRRTAQKCMDLSKEGHTETIQNKTGLVLDAYFSGTKIQWILSQNAENRRLAETGELIFGTIDTWLIWNLSNGKFHVTDPSNASRTMLYNIHTLNWDDQLLGMLNVPKPMMPIVKSSSENIGSIQLKGWDDEVMISGIAGDQQAALFGQLCFNPGDVKNTYGTGCFCVMNTGKSPVQSKNKMLTTIAWQINNETHYALEGSVFIGGALIQWLRDGMNMISSSAEIEQLAESVNDNGGVTFISALTGLGAPYWNPNATGAIMGITRGTKKGHIARAALEAIAIRSREIITEMEKDAGIKYQSLKVDGGASQNNLLMQIQADLLNTLVIRPKTTETTALGVAFLAGLASGFWKNKEEIKSLWKKEREFVPVPNTPAQNTIELWEKRISKIVMNES